MNDPMPRVRYASDTPEDAARLTGYSVDQWREARDILGDYWDAAWETVAHLAVRGDQSPAQVARILVGDSGFPGLLHRL